VRPPRGPEDRAAPPLFLRRRLRPRGLRRPWGRGDPGTRVGPGAAGDPRLGARGAVTGKGCRGRAGGRGCGERAWLLPYAELC
jgi:hypothetical protein